MEKVYPLSNIRKIHLKKLNDVFIKVICDSEDTIEEIASFFTFLTPNYQFDPLYKRKLWDGRVRLFDKRGNKLYIGLLPSMYEFAKKLDYELVVDPKLTEFKHVELEKVIQYMDEYVQPHIVDKEGVLVSPHDYQYKSLHKVVQYKRCLLLCPTGSGKSLIAYSMIRFMQSLKNTKKILLIVPTTALVEQMYADFIDYSKENGWNTEKHCHRIHQLYDKHSDKQVFISTWQSIYEMPKDYFTQFNSVVVDECFVGDSLVLTPDGYIPIKNIKIGDTVTNYDEHNKIFKEDIVVNVFKNMKHTKNDGVIRITLENNKTITVTENHKFLTKNGWVMAKNLTENDDIININR